MAVTYTTNKSFAQVTVGTEAGTWGPYVNANAGLLDTMLGSVTTIALLNTPVTLSSAQYQCAFVRLTGAITANIALTFPPVGSFYTVLNDCTNSSAFVVTAQTSVGGGRVIGLPPGSMTGIMTDATNARYMSTPPVGSYWDYAGSSVPLWVTACTVPPYLNCDGTAFSSVTYPHLANALGGTTLPDLRGRIRATLNQGTGRITSAGGGVDGNTILANGGVQTNTLSSQNLPNIAFPVTDPGHAHAVRSSAFTAAAPGQSVVTSPLTSSTAGSANGDTNTALTGITVNSGGSGTAISNLPPMTISGITMVRSI